MSAITCEAVGHSRDGVIALGTSNGGVSWTAQSLPAGILNLHAIACGSATACYAVGSSRNAGPLVLAYR